MLHAPWASGMLAMPADANLAARTRSDALLYGETIILVTIW